MSFSKNSRSLHFRALLDLGESDNQSRKFGLWLTNCWRRWATCSAEKPLLQLRTTVHRDTIQFDDAGNLLVLQVGQGIVSLQLDDADGICVWAPSKQTTVSNTAVSRSWIAVSSNGPILMLMLPAQSRNDTFDRREKLVRVRPYCSLFMDLWFFHWHRWPRWYLEWIRMTTPREHS